MSSAEKVVCVTGASGFIASWIVKFLLQRGYTVKATVLDINNPDQTQHLLALDGAKERIHLFEAELTEEGSFDSAVDGCEGVFHTASPVSFSKGDPQAELIDPAVKGTLNVLQSCAKVPSIKRVVVTSSLGSVIFTGKPFTPDVVVDETWYSDPAFCEKSKTYPASISALSFAIVGVSKHKAILVTKLWYMLSKTLAERAAWEFAKENRIDLVTMNPGIVIGPLLPPILNLSVKIILNLIDGSQTYQNSSYRYVDVRDVANAHILAFEKPSASGRYILAGKSVHNDEALKILHSLYPSLPLPAKCDDSSYFGIEVQKYEVSTEKAKGIGVEFTPLEASIRDTVEISRALYYDDRSADILSRKQHRVLSNTMRLFRL